ncbi:MAG: hypothetical protein ACON5N_06475, partial [Akkermansiaceae bacterium]
MKNPKFPPTKTRRPILIMVAACLMANSCKSGDEPSEADSSNEPAPPDDSIQIIIKPQVTREIEGISQLDRKKYFS